MNYSFDRGTVKDWYASNDWTNLVYFKCDYTNRVYELITTGENGKPIRVDAYDGILINRSVTGLRTKVAELSLDEFEKFVGNNVLMNVSHWDVTWNNGFTWNVL